MLELLHLGGRSLPHAVLMMIPEAWENHTAMDPARRAFYRYHASLMEPWDGPAAVVFTDGTVVGRGARPQRPASGPLLGHRRRARGARLRGGRARHRPGQGGAQGPPQPGRMFLVDTAQGRIVDDDEIKAQLAAEHPYGEWLAAGQVTLTTCRRG